MFITALKTLIFDDGTCKGAETFESKKLLTSVRDKTIILCGRSTSCIVAHLVALALTCL